VVPSRVFRSDGLSAWITPPCHRGAFSAAGLLAGRGAGKARKSSFDVTYLFAGVDLQVFGTASVSHAKHATAAHFRSDRSPAWIAKPYSKIYSSLS